MVEYIILSYTGSSMFPTLKTGDALSMAKYEQTGVHNGDVIAFKSPYGRALVVHRVVAVDQRVVRTKGDNNLKDDDWVLSPNSIVGRVVSIRRGGKAIPIFNGFWGRRYVSALRVVKWINSALMSVTLSPVYHRLAKASIFKKFSCRVGVRLICFNHGDALQFQLLLGRRVIGRLFPGQKHWYIRCPFRLIVDEASLPQNNSRDLVSFQHSLS